MSWFRKLTATFRPQPLENALEDEFRFHLEQRIDDLAAQGMSRAQAEREAAARFGNRTLLREATRERDVLVPIETTLQDLRYALRMLRRNPGFTAAAVLSLALGIGANTAIFTLLDQVLLRQLPVAHPEQLVELRIDGAIRGVNIGDSSLTYPLYREVRDRNQVFSGVIGHFTTPVSVSFRDRTERVEGELVTGNYFEVLGVGAAIGRTFNQQDDLSPGGHPLAVLNYDYWVNRFGADGSVIGRRIIVDGLPLTIIGVSDKGFDGIAPGHSAKLRIPIAMKAQMTQGYFADFFSLTNPRAYWVLVTARLQTGITRQAARASLEPLYHSMLERELRGPGFETASAGERAEFLKSSLDVLPGSRGYSVLRREYDAPLRILMGIVVLVLFIACANVANLLLARAAARQREIAVRLAIGASVARVARQALVESLLLALGGGMAGVLLAVWLDNALLRFFPTDYGPANLMTVPDLRILSFTLAVCVVTGLSFGLVPVLAARKVDLAPTLKADGRAGLGGRAYFRRALVIAQVSVSALLLIAAGQFLRSLANLHNVDTGMQTRNVVAFAVNPSLNGYNQQQSRQFYSALLENLRRADGIADVAVAAVPVLDEDWWSPAISLDDAGPQTSKENPNANLVSAGYFATMGIPLEAGRDFTAADAGSKHSVAIINRAFARSYFAGKNPVGHRIGLGNDPGTKTDIEIVGMTRDSKFYDVRREIRPQIYFDNDQNPDIQQINVYVRTARTTGQLSATVRQVVRRLDPDVPVFALRSLTEQAELTLARENMLTSLTSIFGTLATILAAIGIYGLMSFNVARRTPEIALRMALGAHARTVKWLVVREVLTLAAAGIGIALPLAWGLTRLFESQLYGVGRGDLSSFWVTALGLAAVAVLAGYLPARRAAGIEPIQALRSE